MLLVKKTMSFRLEESIANDFKQFVFNKYGYLYGAVSEEVKNAIAHWMNEHGANTHVNTQINPGIPKTQVKIDGVIGWLRSKGFTNQFSINDWQRACIETVGSDKRTVEKYLKLSEKIGRIKHYQGCVWEIV